MDKIPLTVCVLTLNEAHNIEECLRSVEAADEILVGDTGSTDGTVKKAESIATKVFDLEFNGFGPTRRVLTGYASNDWVLSLDADERITPGLWDEIAALVTSESAITGLRVIRRSYFLGQVMRCWAGSYDLRLYRRSAGGYNDANIHEGINLKGEIANASGVMEHYTDPNLRHVLQKMNAYSTANAASLIRHGKKHISLLSAFVHASATFFRIYIGKKAFLDGGTGLVFAVVQSLFNWFRYLKAWEIKSGITKMPEIKEYMRK